MRVQEPVCEEAAERAVSEAADEPEFTDKELMRIRLVATRRVLRYAEEDREAAEAEQR